MDIYLWSLLLGGVGLVTMAVTGLGRHGGGAQGSGHGGGSGHASGGSGTGGHGAAGHGPGHSIGAFRGGSKGGQHGGARGGGSRAFLALSSPRVIFSLALGFGGVGLALHPILDHIPILGGLLLPVAALAGGVLFERLVVTRIWNASLRFASNPASTLESSVDDEGTAVTTFDANGQGIVAIEVDGQVLQILGTLQPADRQMGIKVRAGERVRIEAVDEARNRCTVSLV